MPSKRSFDQLLLVTVLIMMGIGMVMVYNASAIPAVRRFGCSPYHFLRLHFYHLLAAILLLLVAMKSPYTMWEKCSPFIFSISFVFLLLVFIPQIGFRWGGARRWIKIAPFLSFQPSELAKIAIILYMASLLARKKDQPDEPKSILSPPFIMLALLFALVVAQPDLGTGALIMFVCISMLFVAGIDLQRLIILIVCFLCCMSILICMKPYGKERLAAYLNPEYDPEGIGYQPNRSKIAIGSGGKTGLGLGESLQKGISIPEPFTDFIFAVIGKEVGLIGASLIVCLFFIIAWRGLRIAGNCKDIFGQYLSIGITCMIGYQGLINMGVVTGLLPTKGIGLPFISYGGSSLVFNSFGVGILLNVSQYS